MFNNAPKRALAPASTSFTPKKRTVKKPSVMTKPFKTSMPMAKVAKKAVMKPQMVNAVKRGVRIPTKSKIRKSTGEIKNPTRADVRKYNSMYKTIR